MDLLEVKLPKRIVIGTKALEKIGSMCKEIDLKGNATIFTDSNVVNIAGKRVSEILESYDYRTNIGVLSKDSEITLMKSLKNSDFILGVGGGKIIDFAKMTAKTCNKPFISVPTAISHDGIASDRAVVNETYSVQAVMPTAIVIDTEIIAKSPYRLTASGCGDSIAKLTAVEDWKLSHEKTGEYISEYAATINRTSADLIIESAKSIRSLEPKGLRNLIEALVFSGVAMSIAGSSRPASGSEHLFSHALKILYPNKKSLHGEECGVGTILCSYFHDMYWQRIVKALEVIGAPKNSDDLGIPEDVIIKALIEAKNLRADRYTILNFKDVDEKKARQAARETGVI